MSVEMSCGMVSLFSYLAYYLAAATIQWLRHQGNSSFFPGVFHAELFQWLNLFMTVDHYTCFNREPVSSGEEARYQVQQLLGQQSVCYAIYSVNLVYLVWKNSYFSTQLEAIDDTHYCLLPLLLCRRAFLHGFGMFCRARGYLKKLTLQLLLYAPLVSSRWPSHWEHCNWC